MDSGQIVHNKKAVKTLREKAVAEMSTRGINISASENTQALALFPKVRYIFVILMGP
jgi:4-hydroxy-3-methylbut-2-enyl diphosphate reductase IspH